MIWHPDMPEEYKNQIVTGDAQELAKRIPDESVDLIFTDPPYSKEYWYLYEWLTVIASRVLKPSGFLLTYAGPYWKADVMKRLNEHLDYFWDFILMHKGNTTILWTRRIISRYKSILAYVLKDSKALPRTNVIGLIPGEGSSKNFHHWGQGKRPATLLIDCFSRPNDIVVDFMAGAGTFVAVCKELGRNYIAFEIDPDTAELARERVRTTQPPLFVIEPEQLELNR